MENQNLKKETYIAEDGLLYCAKCHTPCEKVLPSSRWRRGSYGVYI
jgi:DNA replication protein DnaC